MTAEETKMERDLIWLEREVRKLLAQGVKTTLQLVIDNGRIKGFHAQEYVENPALRR